MTRRRRRLLALGLLVASALAGCATYRDRTSPCACDFRPINGQPSAHPSEGRTQT